MSDFAPEEGNRVEPPRFPDTPASTFRLYNHPAIGFPLVVLGVLVLFINGILEARNQQSQPWIDAVWSPDGTKVLTATKCDLCVGQSGGPACQQACPHDALIRIDFQDAGTLSDWLKLAP